MHHTVLAPEDVIEIGGIPVTTPVRTAFDVGRRLPRTEAVILFDGLLRRSVLDAGALAELARQRSRWPGIARLRTVLSLADGRAESPMETRLRLLLHDGGVPAPQPRFEVHDEHGRLIARVDLGWPAARLAVEYEGDHHRGRDQYRRDVTRSHMLLRYGWTTLRFTAHDVLHLPRDTVLAVAAELRRRR